MYSPSTEDRPTPAAALCALLGVEVPIVQAPVGSATCPALAAAVSNAGALGTLAITARDADEVGDLLRDTRALTDRPFGVNLVLTSPPGDRVRRCLDAGVRVFSFSWGDPAEQVPLVREAGGVVLDTVGSASEARAARARGADAVVAQGWEAGGHVWGHVGTLALVPRVVDAVAPAPALAAGGIADGRGLAAALALGAAGVWVGTRFVASREAAAHAYYKARLTNARETDTAYTEVFDVGCPDAPHRVLRNTTLAAWEAAGRPRPTRRPGEGESVAWAGGRAVRRYAAAMPSADTAGDVEAMAMYAGQGVGLVHEILPAGEIVARMAAEARDALARLGALGAAPLFAGAERGAQATSRRPLGA